MAYIGYRIATADASISVAGEAIAVYGIQLSSAGGGAGSVVLRNGTSSTDTAVLTYNGSGANAFDNFTLAGGQGVVFPSGCFADIGANTSGVTVFYQRVGS